MHGFLPIIMAVVVTLFAFLVGFTKKKLNIEIDSIDKALLAFTAVCAAIALPVYAAEEGGTLFGNALAYWIVGGLAVVICGLAVLTAIKPQRQRA